MAQNFILKFGKFKGQYFQNTPDWYQNWLLNQDWFKVPTNDELTNVQREISQISKSLKGWDGYGRRGQAAYDRMFELEKMEEDIMYCNCGKLNEVGRRDCGWDCGY